MIRILGIDPGFQTTGYGVIDLDGNHLRHVAHGAITAGNGKVGERLGIIFRGISEVLAEYAPLEVSVEKVFMHRNADSALKLGQARGAAITACAERGVAVYEYTPNQIKQATVGKGHAAKQQVQHMVRVLMCLPGPPRPDAADALAVAICHGHFREGLRRMGGVTAVRRGRLR